MPTIKPGDTFFDILPDGRYERCVLLQTDGSEPDRHAAARGGSGEFYRPIPDDEVQAELGKEDSPRLEAAQMIFAHGPHGIPKIVFLERIPTV